LIIFKYPQYVRSSAIVTENGEAAQLVPASAKQEKVIEFYSDILYATKLMVSTEISGI
jgi:hypothetical protein